MSLFESLPGIEFVDADPEACRAKVITGYEAATGTTLYPGNPERLFLEGLAYVLAIYAGLVEHAGRMGTLAYAEGGHLDHIGAEADSPRLDLLPASATIRYSIKEALDWDVNIIGGSRVTTVDQKAVFATDEDALIESGKLFTDVTATALSGGSAGNGLVPGQICRMVDVIPYIDKVGNLTTSVSGADAESDAEYRLRLHGAREAYTCAGPRGMYEYHVKKVHKDIADTGIYTPVPGTVAVCPIMKGGALPPADVLQAIREALNAEDVRPLTDTVLVRAPEETPYAVDLSWHLDKKDAALSGGIGAAVARAVEEYRQWQHGKPGRDINPDELLARLKNAGAKRAEIRSPLFTALEPYQIARCTSVNVSYAGQEEE